ncbi:hypothetical protein [Winogradskyella sp. PG-2]|uniref:hypothetical protein n=1 Tax=Winogradskyella sp. PG-2 TaxID=754409 RepID=UPI001184DD0D|nr:hypothetical protein [Winogradskyella sp. PG-2]
MKKLFKKILVVAVVLGTYAGYASETLEVVPTINNVKKGNLISVSDASGQIIYSGRINYNGNLTSIFNFNQLDDGVYKIEINRDFVIEINKILIKDGVVTYLKDSKEKIYKPVFRVEDSKVFISKIAFDSNEMTIEFYYENELIHTDTVKGNKILNRIYKLDETLRGDYTATVKTNERVYIENFKL